MLSTILLIVLLFGILYWFSYICSKEFPWLRYNKKWIEYTNTNYHLIIYKNKTYEIYNYTTLIKQGTLKHNIQYEVLNVLKNNTNKVINNDYNMLLKINGNIVNIDYNEPPLPKLITILDDIIDS